MDQKARLEQQYIQLLEKRIADLEALVSKPGNSTADDSATENSKKEDEKKGKTEVNYAYVLTSTSTNFYRASPTRSPESET